VAEQLSLPQRYPEVTRIPHHVGIIMDGNGRWAHARGLPRTAGHQAGVEAVRRILTACGELGIRTVTLYTFSTENWCRPRVEVAFLMQLVKAYAIHELPELQRNGVRLQLMGRREGLPEAVVNSLAPLQPGGQQHRQRVLRG